MSEKYEALTKKIDWKKSGGLVPVIVQDREKNVLTLAYMNEEALSLTLKTGFAHYFSRSKERIRRKGEVSGNTQQLVEIKLDCDQDALLLTVKQKGTACHTGHYSCFYETITGELDQPVEKIDYSLNYLKELEDLIRTRKAEMPEGSYTTKLFTDGREKIYKKFGEEAVEVLVAETRDSLIYELGDLFYHLFVLLAYNDIKFDEIIEELAKRRK
ncbi:MAG TPA: bifunctional phosphoribosyl-AMP cyclohydrolase/phosphoribosyl-ATP diphosphatase HisIE [Thermotogota bacterium]|nr:bifunctional phosphoribosyl-AMP cyclohydrolase/phosphoribosyl-ATP diphosphatase HisIE [Thermotogota bacterium]HPJ89818.1 bifunctional phosphoribosyl-AMP cyclohydrolase/phosphoribosyl-ATP diphosphatase HisIE [Thermotogota bacterium]HPR96969.1 bifunctional phosphoribosyl-AMP cyclohydrolase/phosphoribosyl-ATP diphosphatase HisIE [Thermotogota bacterium]